MSTFNFYLEYDGKRSLSNPYGTPIDQIEADGVNGASNRFAEKNHLKKLDVDELSADEFRIYYESRRFLGRSKDIIYYVKKD